MLGSAALVYSNEPSVIIIANDSFSTQRSEAAALAMGWRILSRMSVSEAVLRLGNQLTPDTIMVELTEDSGAQLDRTLDQIDALATQEGASLIVSITPDLIDLVTARIKSPSAAILCNPTAADRVAALSLVWGQRNTRVHDKSQEFDALRLQHLADEVGRIAKTLASMNETSELGNSRKGVSDAMLGFKFQSEVMHQPEISGAEIRSIIKMRRMREHHFDAELFADPAWDMMLDLMAARVERSKVSVSSLCIAASVPATTALRWIKTMTDQGLFIRVADPTDGRRVFIELADATAAKISKYLMDIKRTGSLAI